MIITELISYDRASFYVKAKQIETDNSYILMSYGTNVCSIDKKTKAFSRHWASYSNTTGRHINSFLLTHGLPKMPKSEWDKLPVTVCEL